MPPAPSWPPISYRPSRVPTVIAIGRRRLYCRAALGGLSLVDGRAGVNLTDVFHDTLRHIPLGLQSPHRAARFLQEILEPREFGEHVVDHRFLLADAVECDLYVSEQVRNRVGFALDIVYELTAALDGDNLFLRPRQAVAKPLQFTCSAGDLGSAFGDGCQVGLALLPEGVDTFYPAPHGVDHLLAFRDSLNLAFHVV